MKMAKLLPTKRAKAEISKMDSRHPLLFSYQSEKNSRKAIKTIGAVTKVNEPITHLAGVVLRSAINTKPAAAVATVRARTTTNRSRELHLRIGEGA